MEKWGELHEWRRECPNQYISPSCTLVRRYSRDTYSTGMNCAPHLPRVHPNSRAIFAQVWAGVWAKTFDGRFGSVEKRSNYIRSALAPTGYGFRATGSRDFLARKRRAEPSAVVGMTPAPEQVSIPRDVDARPIEEQARRGYWLAH
jgi:hypothetical protein